VVRLREELNWFEKMPLFGRKIVVTRAREQASRFLHELSLLGADCIEFPTIEVVAPESWGPLDRAIGELDRYQWLLFTSVNGVKHFLERLQVLKRDVRDLKGLKIGAIGPKTAEMLRHMGIRPNLIPDEYRAEAVIASFKKWPIQGTRILLPRAAQAREILPKKLKEMGAAIDVVSAYRTVKPEKDTMRIRQLLEEKAIDMVTFTSSSTVMNFISMFQADRTRFQACMSRVAVACIGPITAKTAQENGLQVKVVSTEYTVEGLIQSILDYYGTNGSKPLSARLV
jgi:uroporphyrinogen III methyltransferase/synthase